ncbi:low-affinity phosphate transporter [Serendipita sp. 400]|nr:low-affinity phosphate transporter [Serendipita sp. 400]
MLFKRRITNVYNTAVGLKSYAELNYSGFRKILKKYDKVLDSELQGPYLHEKVQRAYPWLPPTKGKLDHWITTLVNLYAKCVTHGDHLAAEKQLELYQREQVVWERDTVWRQMIAQERRGEIGDGPKAIGESTKKGKKPVWIDFESKWGRIRISKRVVYFSVALSVFVALLIKPVLDRPEPSNCFAILCFATVLWATEAIPLFVTSILVPFLLCIFRVIRSQDEFDQRLTTSQATKYIFSVMFSPTIMLLIGGFTIASALSKTNIDRVLITRVLSFAGTRPSTVLLSFMFVSCFASMWISNVAAPTLCFTLIRPILRTLPPKSSFAPCLILAIALAANIGGQSSPISSPQNLIVLQHMDPPLDWLEWFSVALPVSGLSIILIWLFLLLSYKPGRTADGTTLEIKPIRASKEKFTFRQYWVSFVCVVTIGLWCVEHSIEEWVGDMGLVAIIPIVAFFSTGVLKKDDFEQFLWSIVFIAMGGSALGKAVQTSKLLEAMDIVIRDMIDGLSFYVVVIVLSAVVLVISTFISHTIASVLLVPIAAEVGANLPVPHPNLLMFLTGLICSTGMGMPVSGFPNQTAATQTDDVGELYLTNVDFLKNGVPASIIAAVVVATLGFALMKAIGLQ